MTKTLTAALGTLALLTFASVASADTIKTGDSLTVSDWNNTMADNACVSGQGCGGEFKATANGESWVTFCLELPEHIQFGPTYYARVNSGAVNGGAGGQLPNSNFDPLSDETAFVYWTYRNGNPAKWSGADVQFFIWYQENELATYNGTAPLSAFAKDAGWTNNGRVVVLNLYGSSAMSATDTKQDLLATVPEPASLLTLGTGLVSLAARLRRKRA